MEKEQRAQFNAFRAFRKEEEYWILKSRIIWLQAGDRNTSFFHRQCRARLSHNHILEISSLDGELFKGQCQIMQAAEIHFQGLFSETGLKENDLNSEFLSNIPSLVSNETNEGLMEPFTEEEIIDVIWSMEPDKSPGLDGFSFHFIEFVG